MAKTLENTDDALMDSPAPAKRLAVSVSEAAAMLGLGRDLAYEAVRTGEIPSIKIGRRVLVPLAALEKMLADAGGKVAA